MLMGIGAAVFALAASAGAQTSILRMEILFQFIAGDQVMPAGQYVVRIDEGFRRVQFDSLEGGRTHVAPLSTKMSERKISLAELGTLQFQAYGEHYVLRAVWRPGETEGHNLIPSKTERELAQRYSPAEVANVLLKAK